MKVTLFCERCRQPCLHRQPGDACPWCWAQDGIENPLVSASLPPAAVTGLLPRRREPTHSASATRASARAEPIPHRQAVSIRDHALLVDEPPGLGGQDAGPDPFELIAAAVASCTSITIGIYARRHGWQVEGLRTDCQISTDPLAGRRLEVTLHFGDDLTDAQRKRLAAVARKCPVRRLLSSQTEFVDRIGR
ncbi:MAG: OsmC family protein [Solirubrobacterales bacterium]